MAIIDEMLGEINKRAGMDTIRQRIHELKNHPSPLEKEVDSPQNRGVIRTLSASGASAAALYLSLAAAALGVASCGGGPTAPSQQQQCTSYGVQWGATCDPATKTQKGTLLYLPSGCTGTPPGPVPPLEQACTPLSPSKINITFVSASSLTGSPGNGRLYLDGADIGAITNSSFSKEGITPGNRILKATFDNGYDRNAILVVPSGVNAQYIVLMGKDYNGAGVMARIDEMNRSNSAESGYRGEKPVAKNGLKRPAAPLNVYWDAIIHPEQLADFRKDHLQQLQNYINYMRSRPFFSSVRLFYVCDPANKPSDILNCDVKDMPPDGTDGVHSVKQYGGGTSNWSWIKNSPVPNTVSSSLTVISYQQGSFAQDFIAAMIGNSVDYRGPKGIPGDSIFNDENIGHAGSPTPLDGVIIDTVGAMNQTTLSPFNDSAFFSISPTSTLLLKPGVATSATPYGVTNVQPNYITPTNTVPLNSPARLNGIIQVPNGPAPPDAVRQKRDAPYRQKIPYRP